MIYFIEDVPESFSVNRDDVLIALTPMACYILDKMNLQYKIPEDFYDETSIKKGEDEYFFDQLRWFQKFDELVEKIIPFRGESRISLVWLYFYFLKHVIDRPLLYVYIFKEVNKRLGKEKIIYISKDHSAELTGLRDERTLFYSNDFINHVLIPVYCAKNNIPFETITIKSSRDTDAGQLSPKKAGFKAGLRSSIIKNRKLYAFARKVKLFGILFNVNRIPGLGAFFKSVNKSGGRTLLFLKSGWGLEQQAREALQRGHRVIIKDGKRFYEHTGMRLRRIDELPDYDNSPSDRYWDAAKKRPEFESEILSWINKKSGCDTSGIVNDKLRFFFNKVCPEIVFYHRFFMEFIDSEKIDYIIAPHLWLPEEFGAMSAAKTSKTAKGILTQHGAEVFDNYFSDMIRLGVVDIFVPFFQELKDFYENRKDLFPIPMAKQVLASFYFDEISKREYAARKKRKRSAREIIVYVPTFFNFFARRFNSTEYTPTWYYRHQLHLLEYLSTKTEFDFIWKGRSAADGDVNPIPFIIREKGYSNISISDKKFVEHLSTANRVITDWGSSAFYESIAAGVPTICLSHRSVRIRPGIKEFFGKSFQEFTEFDEARGHIKAFLQDDPAEYIKVLPQADGDFMTSLELLSTSNQH